MFSFFTSSSTPLQSDLLFPLQQCLRGDTILGESARSPGSAGSLPMDISVTPKELRAANFPTRSPWWSFTPTLSPRPPRLVELQSDVRAAVPSAATRLLAPLQTWMSDDGLLNNARSVYYALALPFGHGFNGALLRFPCAFPISRI